MPEATDQAPEATIDPAQVVESAKKLGAPYPTSLVSLHHALKIATGTRPTGRAPREATIELIRYVRHNENLSAQQAIIVLGSGILLPYEKVSILLAAGYTADEMYTEEVLNLLTNSDYQSDVALRVFKTLDESKSPTYGATE